MPLVHRLPLGVFFLFIAATAAPLQLIVKGFLVAPYVRTVTVSADERMEDLRQRVARLARHPVKALVSNGLLLDADATVAISGIGVGGPVGALCGGLRGGMMESEEPGASHEPAEEQPLTRTGHDHGHGRLDVSSALF